MTEEVNPSLGTDLQGAADRIGSILDPKPKATEAKPEAPTEREASTATDKGEQVTEEASSETQEATAEAEQAPQFNSIQELAEALEMPLDEFLGKVKGKVKVNGVEQEVTLKELRDGYQMESDYRRKTSELAEHRKAFEAERERIATELGRQYQESQQLTGMLEQQLMADYNAVDWANLRASDPAEFAAKKQEYNDRFAQIQGIKQNVQFELQRQAQEAQQKQSYQLQTFLDEEKVKLKSAIPEMADEVKGKELRGKIKDYLRADGYSDEDIGSVYDHRHVKYLYKAMAYDELMSKKVETKHKVVQAPKLQKSGKTEGSGNQRAIADLRSKLRKSGRVEDAAALIKL